VTRRLAKEFRQLAPWPLAAVALLFAFGPFVEPGPGFPFAVMSYLLLSVFVPAARSFGAEFDEGTMAQLLSQPMARARIWREKLLALAITTGLAYGALQLARYLFYGWELGAADMLMCLAAVTGGPLVSLYLRQSFLAFLGAISLPSVPIWIWLAVVYLVRGDIHVGFFWVHLPPAIVYGPLAYLGARRRFLTLELDRGPSASLDLRGFFRVRPERHWGVTARLILKELQIQSPNLLVAGVAIFLWSLLCGMAAASVGGAWFGPLSIMTAMPSGLLILVFPLLLGSTAVAAERQLGVADWHASLPVSRARQWWIKVLVVASLAAGGSILAGFLDRSLAALLDARELPWVPTADILPWLAAAVGVYASSRSREPMRALMGGIVLLVIALLPTASLTAFAIRGRGLTSFLFPDFPGARLYLGITPPILALLVLAFGGFRPEPWHWEKRETQALRSVVLVGLLLTIGFW